MLPLDAPLAAPTDACTLADRLSQLEASLLHATSVDRYAVDAALECARASGNRALLGRALCLLSRIQIIAGQAEAALLTAHEGTRVFAALHGPEALRHAGYHAETLRSAATALLKLGRIGEGLPKLDEAVRIAQAGVDLATPDTPNPTVISAVSALIRSLVTLGLGLFSIRETDTAIDVYHRAMAVGEAHREAYAHFLDDLMLAHWSLIEALHDRVKRHRSAGDNAAAERDTSTARAVLDAQSWRVAGSGHVAGSDAGQLGQFGRVGYYAAFGQHLLVCHKPAEAQAMYERLMREIEGLPFLRDWLFAEAQTGLAQAALALGSPRAALEHSRCALAALARHDDPCIRVAVLLVRAQAYRAVGRPKAAYTLLEQHHASRAGLEAVAAQNYAQHMTARLGLERARADAESHRHIAAMLETLGKIGQEITANLDTDTVFGMLHRHVGELLLATTFTVWLLDGGDHLTLRFGIEDDRPLHGPDIPLNHPHSFAARAARERRETIVDANHRPETLPRLGGGTRKMKTALFAPLIVAERVLGVISIQSHSIDAYTENDRLIFRTLSTYGAIALDNAAAYRKLAQTVVTLQSTQSELAVRTAEYERLSMTDPLTAVANRRHLDERAAIEIAELRRKDTELAVAMFDIDYFKRVNDSYGHAAGDIVLQAVARIAKSWLRPADFIARIGGEEFALLLPGAGIREALAIAERIRSSIAETPIVAGDATIRVTSSFGVATFDAALDTLDRALSRADSALYASKQAGRNLVRSSP